MVNVPVVFGRWVQMRDTSWHFDIEKTKGGRMFVLRDGCTHAELVEMALEDYELTLMVDLSYSLPENMLKHMPLDTPPIYVSNDRQVRSLVELSGEHVIRLCISSRCEIDIDGDNIRQEAEEAKDVDVDKLPDSIYADKPRDEPVDEETEGVVDEDMKDDENVEVKDVSSDSDADYSIYGKMDDSDEDDDDSDFDDEQYNVGAVRGNSNWCDPLRERKSYPSKNELVSEVRTTALMQKFSYKVHKSRPHLFVATCTVEGCSWRIRASLKNEANTFFVTKYVNTHSCSVADRTCKRRTCTPVFIAKLFIDHFGTVDGVIPLHVKSSMKNLFSLKLSYTTSYRALIAAQELVRGSPEEGYEKLPSYLQHLGQFNPGTITDLVCDDDNRFKYLFISFGASIAGFRYLRRVIVVDGTHLNGKYEGVLLVAAGQDANFQVFPLAFGIVDSECDASWEWFFTNLQRCFSDEYPMTIVSDRHASIAKACETVMPWATRGICYYHLQQNIVTRYRGKEIMYLVKGAAYAYTLVDFNRYMDTIREINPALADYLVEADPKLWSRVHFPGDRYNIKTSNIAESLNAVLKKARGFPISFLLEFIREMLCRWFYKRREDALRLTTRHSRGVETLLIIREDYAGRMNVQRLDRWRFDVRSGRRGYIVDLERSTCSCGLVCVEKIPCSHFIAAAKDAGVDYSNYVFPVYSKNSLYSTYEHAINPIHECVETGDVVVRPPVVKRAPGRRRKSRWQTWLELAKKRGSKPRRTTKHYNCSKCKQPGHTRPHCVQDD